MVKKRNTVPHVVVLTGAGISACSGLDTFRAADGVWARYNIQDVCTPAGFRKNPDLLHKFYNARRATLKRVIPNAAHKALVVLEQALEKAGGSLFVVTQNVDNLHSRAGSKQLLHMHGELTRAVCVMCGVGQNWESDLYTHTSCPSCGKQGGMRPDIVWFGEVPKELDEIDRRLHMASHFVAIGTSGAVYPAAGFVAQARQAGILCTELNLEPSDNSSLFTAQRYGKASKIVSQWVQEFAQEYRLSIIDFDAANKI